MAHAAFLGCGPCPHPFPIDQQLLDLRDALGNGHDLFGEAEDASEDGDDLWSVLSTNESLGISQLVSGNIALMLQDVFVFLQAPLDNILAHECHPPMLGLNNSSHLNSMRRISYSS